MGKRGISGSEASDSDNEVKYPKFDVAGCSNKKILICPILSATLDRVGLGDRKATQVFAAAARSECKESKAIAVTVQQSEGLE